MEMENDINACDEILMENKEKKDSRRVLSRAKSAPLFNTMSIGRLAKEAHTTKITEQNRKLTARLQFPGEPRRKSVTSLYIELLSPHRRKECARCSGVSTDKGINGSKPRVSSDEMEEIVQRLNRPTFMSTARAVSARRPWRDNKARRRSNETTDYINLVHPDRFSGKGSLSKTAVEKIVSRLYRPSTRDVPVRKSSSQYGIVQSYAWQGIKNL